VAPDDAAAFMWFKKTATQGQTGAQIKLGYMYSAGRGTNKDPETAYSWVSAASIAADPRGKELLHALEKVLTPEQVARSRDRAYGLTYRDQELSARSFAQ
jgi:TPR repeat protein